jgi:hypothetical protein
LRWIERDHDHVAPQLQAVSKSIERLRTDLDALNRRLEEE